MAEARVVEEALVVEAVVVVSRQEMLNSLNLPQYIMALIKAN